MEPGKAGAEANGLVYDTHNNAGSIPGGIVRAPSQATVRQGGLGTEAASRSDSDSAGNWCCHRSLPAVINSAGLAIKREMAR